MREWVFKVSVALVALRAHNPRGPVRVRPTLQISSQLLMKVLILTVLLVLLGLNFSFGQKTVPNVSVKGSSILAVYPELAEFIMNKQNGLLTITRINMDGTYEANSYKAELYECGPDVYRMEFAGSCWLEIDTKTGTSTLYHRKKMETFFRDGFHE